MRTMRCWIMASLVLGYAGCGGGLPGTYVGDVRLMQGRTESSEPGYALEEYRAKIAAEGRTLSLSRNGRLSFTK